MKYLSNAPEIVEALASPRVITESKDKDVDMKVCIGMLNQFEVDGSIKSDCIGIAMPEIDKVGIFEDCRSNGLR